jgi:hypothetical protein
MTVQDLKLNEEQSEQACFLLNYRLGGDYSRTAYNWGTTTLHLFTVDELKTALANDDRLTATSPVRLKKTEYALRVYGELRAILENV